METRSKIDDVESEAAQTLLLLRHESDKRIRWQQAHEKDRVFPYHQSPYFGWPGMYPPIYPLDLSNSMRFYPFMPPQYFPPQGPRPWLQLPPQLYSRQTAPHPEQIGPHPIVYQQYITPKQEEAEDCGDQIEDSDQQTSPISDKRKRRNLNKRQQHTLEAAYSSIKYPTIDDRLKLGQSTQLTEDRIQVWFQNRRAKDRRIQEASQTPHGTDIESMQGQYIDDGEDVGEGSKTTDNPAKRLRLEIPVEVTFK